MDEEQFEELKLQLQDERVKSLTIVLQDVGYMAVTDVFYDAAEDTVKVVLDGSTVE